MQITPIYLQTGKIMGYKASIKCNGYKVVSFSMDSHMDAMKRVIKALWDKVEQREGTNKAILLFKSV